MTSRGRRVRTGRCRCREQGWWGARSDHRAARPVQRAHPHLVRCGVRRAHSRPDGRVGGDRRRAARPRGRADRLRQDAERLPLVDRPAAHDTPAGGPDAPVPGALRLPAQGARRRRRAQPARPADRHPAHRGPARHPRARGAGRGPLRRHPGRRAPQARHRPARHHDHHARVALPDADLAGARVAARGGDGDRRRGARGGGHQARRAPRAHPGAARRAARAAGPADRAVGDRAPARRGGPLPRRQRAGGDRGAPAPPSSGT